MTFQNSSCNIALCQSYNMPVLPFSILMLISLSWNLLAFNRQCKLLSQGQESLKAFGIASCQNAGISPGNTALITKTLIQCVLPLFSYYITVDSYKLRSLHDMFLSFFSPVQILPCEIFLIIIFNVSQTTVLHLNCLLDWLITYFYFIFCGFSPPTLPVRQIFNQCSLTRSNTIHEKVFASRSER